MLCLGAVRHIQIPQNHSTIAPQHHSMVFPPRPCPVKEIPRVRVCVRFWVCEERGGGKLWAGGQVGSCVDG